MQSMQCQPFLEKWEVGSVFLFHTLLLRELWNGAGPLLVRKRKCLYFKLKSEFGMPWCFWRCVVAYPLPSPKPSPVLATSLLLGEVCWSIGRTHGTGSAWCTQQHCRINAWRARGSLGPWVTSLGKAISYPGKGHWLLRGLTGREPKLTPLNFPLSQRPPKAQPPVTGWTRKGYTMDTAGKKKVVTSRVKKSKHCVTESAGIREETAPIPVKRWKQRMRCSRQHQCPCVPSGSVWMMW